MRNRDFITSIQDMDWKLAWSYLNDERVRKQLNLKAWDSMALNEAILHGAPFDLIAEINAMSDSTAHAYRAVASALLMSRFDVVEMLCPDWHTKSSAIQRFKRHASVEARISLGQYIATRPGDLDADTVLGDDAVMSKLYFEARLKKAESHNDMEHPKQRL